MRKIVNKRKGEFQTGYTSFKRIKKGKHERQNEEMNFKYGE